MSRFIAPYGIRFQANGRLEMFPAIELYILGKGSRGIRAVLHIDSGATTSILPASDAELLGFRMTAGKRILIQGVSGEPLIGYRHMAIVQFGDFKVKLPIVFVDRRDIPRILGREGVFNHFAILLDEARHQTALLDEHKERKFLNSIFLPKR